jgi:hypothetical protein
MPTFADKIIAFNQSISFDGALPDGIRIMNPFKENPTILDISATFYKKYYDDNAFRAKRETGRKKCTDYLQKVID